MLIGDGRGLRRASHPQRTPNQGKKPAKEDGKPDISWDRKALCIIECGETRRLRAPIWNRDSRGIESARRCHRINFPRFRCDAWANTWRKLLPESGLAARMPCRLLSVIETAEPGNMRLNARYGMSAAREECPRSDGAPKWPRRNLNLPLAAGPRVRHIRAHGAVAEWLKAAVC